jgi:hypothetical protein
MKTFIAMILACLQHFAMAQSVVQGEYFIDTDAGFGLNKLVNFTPAADGTFSLNVDLSSTPPGFHKLYLRTKDSNGKWAHTTRRLIEVLASEAANKIVSGEYYFDVDPGFDNANTISITAPDSVILQNFTAAVATLSLGYHKMYGRFKDTYGNWSHTFRRNVEVVKGGNNAVMSVEYFFDTDAGFGNCASFTFANPLADGSFAFNIPNNQIPPDVDTLFVRIKDSANGSWSITTYKLNPIALPLTLLDFSATPFGDVVQLNWETSSEINTAFFHIERSSDGANFSGVGKVHAKGTSNTLSRYNYNDDIASISANKIFYRLKMEDKDGSMRYSKVVPINIARKNNWFTVKPNPAKSYVTITLNSSALIGNTTLMIRDMAGLTVLKENVLTNGSQSINISSFPRGVYIISIITPGKTQTEKLIVE